MFEGQPKGLYALALANTGERFGYYTMLAVFVLFLQDNFGWTAAGAGSVYSTFLMFVYFLPFIGGMLADKFGYGRMVTIGVSIMLAGYVLLAIPLGGGYVAVAAMIAALALVSAGTGLFKGNLQVMVGDLFNTPELQGKRDSAFSLFYMAINVGALFAPTAAVKIMDYAQNTMGYSKADSYHFAFAVACVSLVISMAVYFGFRKTFAHVEGGKKKEEESPSAETEAVVDDLTPQETKQRIIALCLVFAVVIFFWMAFHQNGLTLTYFAKDFTATSSSGLQSMMFDVINLVLLIISVYAGFAVWQSKTQKGRIIASVVVGLCFIGLVVKYFFLDESTDVDAPIFQQFNPCFVVGLTPVSIALFGWLAQKGKEPSAPRKIAYGMLVAGVGFSVMILSSIGIGDLEDKVATKFELDQKLEAQIDSVTKAGEYRQLVFDGICAETLAKIDAQFKQEASVRDSADAAKMKEIKAKDKKAAALFEVEMTRKAARMTRLQKKNEAAATEVIARFKAQDEAKTKAEIAELEYQASIRKAEVGAEVALSDNRVSPNWLVLTYLILTFAELLLSPMGISFVSKVAPPKYKGMMMGGWFVATAIGNFLTVIPALLWCKTPLVIVWGTLVVLCLLSFLFIFSQMKKLESVA